MLDVFPDSEKTLDNNLLAHRDLFCNERTGLVTRLK